MDQERPGLDGAAPVVLHPGSGWDLKNWPAERWGTLAAVLRSRHGAPVAVTGAAGEAPLVQAVVDASEGAAVGLAGQLGLPALAALHARARLVVATDSGPLHLAALMGVPVVGLYGPAAPSVFAPWRPCAPARLLWSGLPCSPCGTLVDPPCGATRLPDCVLALSLADVLAAVEDVLRSGLALPSPRRR